MPRRLPEIKIGFEKSGIRLSIADILPLRLIPDSVKSTPKYLQIASSIREVGIVEPPVVARDKEQRGKYLLLDGHLRISVLKDMGEINVICLISHDDEAFTYNKRVNRLAIIQEHKMILKAVDRGVSEERLAKALNVDVSSIRKKRHLLEGICPEAAELLKDKHIGLNAFTELRKMTPMRQIEAAEVMVAMNRYTISYVKSLLTATPDSQLVQPRKQRPRGLTEEQIGLMQRESANLDREFKLAEQSYGTDHLDLVLVKGYLAKLLGNARVVRYLAQSHKEILSEFQKVSELEATAA